jgi:hypothetical protein
VQRSDDPRPQGDASPADARLAHPQHGHTSDDNPRGWWVATGPSAEKRWEALQGYDGDVSAVSDTAHGRADATTVTTVEGGPALVEWFTRARHLIEAVPCDALLDVVRASTLPLVHARRPRIQPQGPTPTHKLLSGPERGERNVQIWEAPTMTAPPPAVLPAAALAGFDVLERARQQRRARSMRVCLLVSPHLTKSSGSSSTSTVQRLATSLGAALHASSLLLPAVAEATDCNVEPLLRPQLLWRGDLVLRGVCDRPKTHSPTSVLMSGGGTTAEKERELRLPGACLYQPPPPSQPLLHTAAAITVPSAVASSLSKLSPSAGGGECTSSSVMGVRVEVGWELEVIQVLSEPLAAHLLAAGAPMVLGVESGVGAVRGGSDPVDPSGVLAGKHQRHTVQVVRELMEGCVGGKAAAGFLARFRPPTAADTTPPSPTAPASSLLSSLPPLCSPPPLLLLYAHRGALYGCEAYGVEPSRIVLCREWTVERTVFVTT